MAYWEYITLAKSTKFDQISAKPLQTANASGSIKFLIFQATCCGMYLLLNTS